LLERNFLGFVKATAWRAFADFLRTIIDDLILDNFRRFEPISAGFSLRIGGHLWMRDKD